MKASRSPARTTEKASAKPKKAAGKPRAAASRRTPRPAAKPAATADGAASKHIDQRIRDLGDWRGETLARMRELILSVDPAIVEEWKWQNPVWSRHGLLCTGEAYKKVVKLTFPRGARLPDPAGLFNSSLGGSIRRAIDIPEGARVDARAFKALVKAAVAENSPAAKKR